MCLREQQQQRQQQLPLNRAYVVGEMCSQRATTHFDLSQGCCSNKLLLATPPNVALSVGKLL